MRVLTFNELYRYDDFLRDTEYLAKTYPSMLQVYEIGKSHDGRSILMFKLGTGAIPVIITAGVHGRETINPMVVMRIMESYLELTEFKEPIVLDFFFPTRLLPTDFTTKSVYSELFYNIEGGFPFFGDEPEPIPLESEEEIPASNAKGEEIPIEYNLYRFLETFTFYIIPMLNPDGYEIALGGFDTIRDSELRQRAIASGIPAKEWKANARGVDLNRNFPSITWRPKFPGDQPGSENETKALMEIFAEIPAIGYLDLHSRGKAIYYNKNTMPKDYNDRQKYIASRLARVTGYELMPPELEIEENDSGGNTVHYFSEYYQRPAITIETVEDSATFPLDTKYQMPTFEEILLAPLEFVAAIVEYPQTLQ